ncbi:MAG: GTPase HflX [Chloroflexota bacterium]
MQSCGRAIIRATVGWRGQPITRSNRCILCAVAPARGAAQAEADLDELAQLCQTAGLDPIERVIQARPGQDPATYVGSGKARELAARSEELGGALVVFDDELSPAQMANLAELIPAGVRDRSTIILDIFAAHARTSEGKLQVELAQLSYALPRLVGHGREMSRLGASAGLFTRGPGETKLEIDRRTIRQRIADLRRDLEDVRRHRGIARQRRQDEGMPLVSLVGYTNAGKSTLMNALTGADVLTRDKLFATLDPTTRQFDLPGNRKALLTDTVGFIRKLPHQLVAAFRATLEEVVQADLLLHVIDASHPDFQSQADAVTSVLAELGAGAKPVLTVYNKVDRLPPEQQSAFSHSAEPSSVAISALRGDNLDALRVAIAAALSRERMTLSLRIPYDRQDLASLARQHGHVTREEYQADALVLTVELDAAWARRIRKRLSESGQGADGDDV